MKTNRLTIALAFLFLTGCTHTASTRLTHPVEPPADLAALCIPGQDAFCSGETAAAPGIRVSALVRP